MGKLSFIPLGGLGEIGKNMALLDYDGEAVMIDAGLMFPDDLHPGVDYIIPDFNFLAEKPGWLKAILLTHGHEDHIGAVPYLLQKLNVPIYGTKLTLGFVKGKLSEFKLKEAPTFVEVDPKVPFQVGPFGIEFIRVTHSIVDACGIAFTTPAGVVVHTGDFKIDPTPIDGIPIDLNRFADYGSKGVLALFSDSTNVEREGYTLSERVVGEEFDRIFPKAKGRIIVACFASNIHRVQQAIDSAKKIGRKVCIMGRSMIRNTNVARELGFMNVPSNMLISPENLKGVDPKQIVVVTTGSQGEPMSSVAKMAMGDHKFMAIQPDDMVLLSARTIPGNERAISNIINLLYRRGAEVLYESVSEIHVSGHACREEQKLMVSLVKPKYFIPVHGEYRHLVLHARLAESVGVDPHNTIVLENGERLIFEEADVRIEKEFSGGTILVDGKSMEDVGEVVLRDRLHLSQDGVVVALITVDPAKGKIVGGPDLVTRGFSESLSDELMNEAKELIRHRLESEVRDKVTDWSTVKETMRKSLQKFFSQKSNRRPVVLPVVMEI
ncbi:MAG TPA: ribonuclease J [bacterium]|nr:ribonuclease J [bacterium]